LGEIKPIKLPEAEEMLLPENVRKIKSVLRENLLF
jgi:hypothetical protein